MIEQRKDLSQRSMRQLDDVVNKMLFPNRLHDDAARLQNKLEHKRLEMARNELEMSTRDKPQINKKSAKMSNKEQPMH